MEWIYPGRTNETNEPQHQWKTKYSYFGSIYNDCSVCARYDPLRSKFQQETAPRNRVPRISVEKSRLCDILWSLPHLSIRAVRVYKKRHQRAPVRVVISILILTMNLSESNTKNLGAELSAFVFFFGAVLLNRGVISKIHNEFLDFFLPPPLYSNAFSAFYPCFNIEP